MTNVILFLFQALITKQVRQLWLIKDNKYSKIYPLQTISVFIPPEQLPSW